MSCSGSSRRTRQPAPHSLRGDGMSWPAPSVATSPRSPPPASDAPGWPDDNEPGYTYGPEYALPGAIMVDRAGRRFCDDSYWVSIVHNVIAPGDRHLSCFMVWDEGHHRRYGMGKTPPGGEYRNDLVVSAPTPLGELGEKLGVDGDELERTVARFNDGAARGEDPEFGRGSVPFVRTYAGDPTTSPTRCWRRWPTPRTSACACTSSAPASARAAYGSMARVTS